MLFSVIIPIYNTEPWLRQCLDSVLAQTCGDYEAILVDDGSPDGCGAICEEYAARDSRFRVIHKPNGGLVSARKAGLREAAGEYVINLDSDDMLLPGMLEDARAIAEKHACPDVISFALTDDRESSVEKEPHEPGLYMKEDIARTILPRVLIDARGVRILHYLCGKAIRRELQARRQFDVPDSVSFGEDTCCTTPIYFDAESVYVADDVRYVYRRRGDSESTLFRITRFEQLEHSVRYLESLQAPEGADYGEQLARYAMMTCFIFIIMYANNGEPGYLPEISKYLKGDVLCPLLRQAVFHGFSLKTRIIMSCLRSGNAAGAYLLYKSGEDIKRLLKGGKR
ncbi:MAG: glycosyltransferase family 2 protein [Abditibacteriota bacterium]|nr:glycosyltransferase family 2 protein [Abditibacteriota bacterium]